MTEYAIPVWIFLALFLFLPLLVIAVMTAGRFRRRQERRRGFDVELRVPPDPENNDSRDGNR